MKLGWRVVFLMVAVFFQELFAGFNSGEKPKGSLVGRIVDADSGEPLGFVFLLIDELHLWQQTSADGTFRFDNLPVGRYQVRSFRIGLQKSIKTVDIRAGQITEILWPIKALPIALGEVVVKENGWQEQSLAKAPEIVISNRRLYQNLGMTIAKTLENEVGLDRISMGPAPARPVLRGLSGDRLLLLEDGERTGDLSATSSDHAVAIEPLTTTRIEVVRGPEALLYGANVMGGAINVVREAVPRFMPQKVMGSMTLQGESVNRGQAVAAECLLPLKTFASRLDFSFRAADDMQTPLGRLNNTYIQTTNGSVGVSLPQKSGHVGVAGGWFQSDYGIPPDPFAGHPSGVDIKMLRQFFLSEGEIDISSPLVRHLFWKYQYSRYQHQEYEKSGFLGMEFGVVTQHVRLMWHFAKWGLLNDARIGLWGEYRDYASGGLSFTPAAKELSGAVYLYNQFVSGRWAINGTIRLDGKRIRPYESYYSPRVGQVRNRHFNNFSAAIAVNHHFNPKLEMGASTMRTFRAPGVEELFSEGPHLAAYAYEVGNADLQQEVGTTGEIYFRCKSDRGSFHLAGFYNHLSNYIFPRNTGRRSLRRADLFVYQYQGHRALLSGAELMAQWLVKRWLTWSLQCQYVQGELLDEHRPMPRIPPLSAQLAWHYHRGPWTVIFQSKAADRQTRVDQFEKPTAGFVVHDLTLQYVGQKWQMLHTVSLTIENIFNSEYRRHLNRVKEIMPEPGRNVRLLYKLFF